MPKPTIPCARRERDASGARGLTETMPVVVTEETAERMRRVKEAYDVSGPDVVRYALAEVLPELERWIGEG